MPGALPAVARKAVSSAAWRAAQEAGGSLAPANISGVEAVAPAILAVGGASGIRGEDNEHLFAGH